MKSKMNSIIKAEQDQIIQTPAIFKKIYNTKKN